MSVRVIIPNAFRALASDASSVQVSADTVAEALQALAQRYPSISPKIQDEAGELKKPLNVYVNREDVRYLQGLETPLKSGDEVILLSPVSGG